MKMLLMFCQIIAIALVIWGFFGILDIKNKERSVNYNYRVGETVLLKPDSSEAIIRSRRYDLNLMDTTMLEPQYEVMLIKNYTILSDVPQSLIFETPEKIKFTDSINFNKH